MAQIVRYFKVDIQYSVTWIDTRMVLETYGELYHCMCHVKLKVNAIKKPDER